MRRKINYIADYMYMVTKPPTGAEPRTEQFVKHKAVVEKLATKLFGEDSEEWLESMAEGLAEFSKEGIKGQPLKFLQKQFAWWIPLEEEEEIMEESKKRLRSLYSISVAIGRQMTKS